MIAFPTSGAVSTSPYPLIPASVSTTMIRSSCVPSAAVEMLGRRSTMALTSVILISEHSILVIDFPKCPAVEKFLAREILFACLFKRLLYHLLFDGVGDCHNAIKVGKDQVAGIDQHAPTGNGNIKSLHPASSHGVDRTDPNAVDGEIHLDDAHAIPDLAVT